jgi:hypothetical protein
MSFDIFDERYYLALNPDVANAVQAGLFSSGLHHFQLFGINEGRVSVSPLYNESLYLQANPDVANAVQARSLTSGLQHYILYGETENRVGLFGLYNEQAYLQRYPDVANAVQSGIFDSGFEHLVQFGLDEGRFDALFDEQYYLQKYSDVADAVQAGIFSSGLQHFLLFGQDEGRSGGVLFNEGFYLRRYPDVANAVQAGIFSSGLAHFAQFGERENRSGTTFNEQAYFTLYPDVANAVQAGFLSSGLDHYLQYGQFEENRSPFFSGSRGNDIVAAFSDDFGFENNFIASITGVEVGQVTASAGDLQDAVLGSFGVGEVDTLIGGDAVDEFYLGFGVTASNPTASIFYTGGGNSDFALIRRFDLNEDLIVLVGTPDQYTTQVVNGSLNISTSAGDLVGVVEGISSLAPIGPGAIPGTLVWG